MDERFFFIKLIFQTSQSVFNEMLQEEIRKGKVDYKDNKIIGHKVNVSIGFTGDVEGFVYFSMDENTALNISEKLSGMKMEEINDFVTSAIGEIANIISGSLSTKLLEQDLKANITTPSITVGDNIEVSSNKEKFIAIPIKNSTLGNIEINLSLYEAK